MIQPNRYLLLALYQEPIFYTADRYSKNVKRIRSFCCLKLYSGLPEKHSKLKPPLLHGLQGLCDVTPSGPSTLICDNRLYSRPSLFPHRGLRCPPANSALLPGSLRVGSFSSFRSPFQHCFYRGLSSLPADALPLLPVSRLLLFSFLQGAYHSLKLSILSLCLSPFPSLEYNPQVGRDPVHLGNRVVPRSGPGT